MSVGMLKKDSFDGICIENDTSIMPNGFIGCFSLPITSFDHLFIVNMYHRRLQDKTFKGRCLIIEMKIFT